MAQVINGQVKLNNGQVVAPQQGGWYDGQQFWGGTLSAPGVINAQSNQVGAGQPVSNEVIAQTNPSNVAYVQQQQQQAGMTPNMGSSAGSVPSGAGAYSMANKPTIDLQGAYDKAYNTPEISSAQSEIDKVDQKIMAMQKARDEAIAINNDNPFYSEATRVGKINQINEKYNADLTTVQNEKTLAAGKLAALKSDAEIKLNLAMKQYDINDAAYKDQLSQFNALLSAGALLNASPEDIASYATATGMPYNLIAGVVAKQKSEEIKPQMITSTSDSGQVTATIIDTATGKVMAQTNLGMIGNAQGGGKATESEKKAYYQNALRSDASRGVNLQDIFKLYQGYLTPNEIIELYNANSMYGPAVETPEQLAKYGVKPVNTPIQY